MLRKKLRLSSETESEEVHKIQTVNVTPSSEQNNQTSKYFQSIPTPLPPLSKSAELLQINDELNLALSAIEFTSPVAHIYNPTIYACDLFTQYLQKYGDTPKDVLFLGMNPGPFGMCQTGVPFGNVSTVTEWLQITGTVQQPANICPKRPITGLETTREETSGQRFWNFFKDLCGLPEVFFKHAFVYNYCPIALMYDTGANITPAELGKAKLNQKVQQQLLEKVCDDALLRILHVLNVKIIVAIGAYVHNKVKKVIKTNENFEIKTLCLAHPSPRSPKSNDWPNLAKKFLEENDILTYFIAEDVAQPPASEKL